MDLLNKLPSTPKSVVAENTSQPHLRAVAISSASAQEFLKGLEELKRMHNKARIDDYADSGEHPNEPSHIAWENWGDWGNFANWAEFHD